MVVVPPDLALTKAHSGNFIVGQNGAYTLSVGNAATAGPTTGPITATDTLPAGLSFLSGIGSGTRPAAVGQTVTRTNPSPLPPGASSKVVLEVGIGPAARPSVTNTATVSTSNETNVANNRASDSSLVALQVVNITVGKSESGSGTVTSVDGQITCGTTCSAGYANGDNVTLTAVPADGSSFVGWSGACVGGGPCQVRVDATTTVNAIFQAIGIGTQVGHQSGRPALQVTFSARPGCGAIDHIEFGSPGRTFDNAEVTITSPADGPSAQTKHFIYTPLPGTTRISLELRRVAESGGATVNPIQIVDGCGAWPTFVGGGPEAFR